MSLTHGQCDARPTVTFPVVEHHCPVIRIPNCSVTEARTCLISRTAESKTDDIEMSQVCPDRLFLATSDALDTTPPGHLPGARTGRHSGGVGVGDHQVSHVFDVSPASRGHLRRQSSQPSLTAHINIPVTP